MVDRIWLWSVSVTFDMLNLCALTVGTRWLVQARTGTAAEDWWGVGEQPESYEAREGEICWGPSHLFCGGRFAQKTTVLKWKKCF